MFAAACASTRKPPVNVAVLKLVAVDENAESSWAIVAFGLACLTSAQNPFIAAFASEVPIVLTTEPPGLTAFHAPDVQNAIFEVEFE